MKTVGLVFKDNKKIAYKNNKTVEIVEKPVENPEKTPVEPTMAELKEKATALGLDFKGNISKAALKALIEDAEKAAELDPEGEKSEGEGNPELDPEGDE